MKKKRRETLQEKKIISNRTIALASIILLILIVGAVLLSRLSWQPQNVEFSFRAAIVDQLSSEFPNSEYNASGSVPNMLMAAGFNVSYFESKNVNVSFYRELARLDYGIIVLRTHSAQRETETLVDLFSSERFDTGKYDSELENGLVTVGYYPWNPGVRYFTIPPKFIESLSNRFPKSIVIAMGCNTLNVTCTEMAEAFIGKGAIAYVGWTGMVATPHTDAENIKLLHAFLNESKTLDQAVRATEPDLDYPNSKMMYYPQAAANLTLSSLRVEKRTSRVIQTLVGDSEFFVQVWWARDLPTKSRALGIELNRIGLPDV